MSRLTDERNIILIGMCGVGKSTVGVLLAKETRREFLDTDVLIQVRDGRGLQEIIDSEGLIGFCRIEEEAILALDVRSHVIATGGSVVYSVSATGRLKDTGPVVYLELPFDVLARRVANLATRGVVIAEGQTLRDIYEERRPLYETWADVTVNCADKTQDEIVMEIIRAIG